MAKQDNLKPFQKGQSGNPNGRPKKKYRQHIEDIKGMGYSAPNREEYYEMIGLLLSMEEDDLKTFAADKQRPYWVRLIIVDLNDKKNRFKIQADYRDWLYGRAKQQLDHTTDNQPMPAVIFMPASKANE